jgi:hypothetical protein
MISAGAITDLHADDITEIRHGQTSLGEPSAYHCRGPRAPKSSMG